MKGLTDLLLVAERCLEQAKKSLDALSGQNSPEDLLSRVKVLRDSYKAVGARLTEKKKALLRGLIELAPLADVYYVRSVDGLVFKVYNGSVYRDRYRDSALNSYGEYISLRSLVSRENDKTFTLLCNLLIEAISQNLTSAVSRLEQLRSDIPVIEDLADKILKIIDPFKEVKK